MLIKPLAAQFMAWVRRPSAHDVMLTCTAIDQIFKNGKEGASLVYPIAHASKIADIIKRLDVIADRADTGGGIIQLFPSGPNGAAAIDFLLTAPEKAFDKTLKNLKLWSDEKTLGGQFVEYPENGNTKLRLNISSLSGDKRTVFINALAMLFPTAYNNLFDEGADMVRVGNQTEVARLRAFLVEGAPLTHRATQAQFEASRAAALRMTAR